MVEAASVEALQNLSEAFPPESGTVPRKPVSGNILDVRSYLGRYGFSVVKEKRNGSSTLFILEQGCLFDSSHTKGEAAIGQTDQGKLFYQCFHESCKGHTWHEARKIISGSDTLFEKSASLPSGSENFKRFLATNDEWGEPINIFNEFSIGDAMWQPYYCPEVISIFAYDEAERMGVRPEQIAGPAIICAAGVIDDKIKLQPKSYDYTWRESARLWGVTTGDSGAKKSPSKDRADAVLKRIEKELYESYKKKYEIFQAELHHQEGLTKKERMETPNPQEPLRQRVICNDTTIEALRDMLGDEAPNRKIICLWDELSGMLATFDAYRQSKTVSRDRSLYLELYNGGPKPIDRAGKVNFYIPNWSACISGTVTDQVMKEYFGRLNSDGLLQRFLLYKAERLGRDMDRRPNPVAEIKYAETIQRLFEFRPDDDQDVIIKLSDGAQKIRDVFERLIEMAYSLPGNTHAFNAHLNKYSGLFCRLTLTYHMLESFSMEEPYLDLTVSEKTAKMASEALIEYHLPVAREFYKNLGFEDKGQEAGQDICGYILSKRLNEVSSRDISANVWKLRNKIHEVRDVMELLTAYGWVRPNKIVGGQPTKWDVNPLVHQRYEQQAKVERERRAETQKKIQVATRIFGRGDK